MLKVLRNLLLATITATCVQASDVETVGEHGKRPVSDPRAIYLEEVFKQQKIVPALRDQTLRNYVVSLGLGSNIQEKLASQLKMLRAMGLYQHCKTGEDVASLLRMSHTLTHEQMVGGKRWMEAVHVWDLNKGIGTLANDLLRYSRTQDNWLSDASDFVEGIVRNGGNESEFFVLEYIIQSKHKAEPIFVEFVCWLKEFRTYEKCRKTNDELDKLWDFVGKNGCWTATVEASKSPQWANRNCAADIIRHIRGAGFESNRGGVVGRSHL